MSEPDIEGAVPEEDRVEELIAAEPEIEPEEYETPDPATVDETVANPADVLEQRTEVAHLDEDEQV